MRFHFLSSRSADLVAEWEVRVIRTSDRVTTSDK